MNALAERYVRLVLALGQHDADYVDAYYGPAEWRTEAQAASVPLAEIEAAATGLAGDLARSGAGGTARRAAAPAALVPGTAAGIAARRAWRCCRAGN